MVLNILGILVTLPSAIYSSFLIVDRLRKGPDDDQGDEEDQPEE